MRGIAKKISVAASGTSTGFLGPFPVGSRINGIYISGRPNSSDLARWSAAFAPNDKNAFTELSHRLTIDASIPLNFGAFVPFGLPARHVVDEDSRYVAFFIDHTSFATAADYVVWLDVSPPSG